MEFIYILKLIDRLYEVENWNKEDEDITSEHYQHLLALKEQGILILAGKTAGLSLDTFGVTIFKADSLDDAMNIMNSDPAIKKGIMTGTLHEYNVAVFNPNYNK